MHPPQRVIDHDQFQNDNQEIDGGEWALMETCRK